MDYKYGPQYTVDAEEANGPIQFRKQSLHHTCRVIETCMHVGTSNQPSPLSFTKAILPLILLACMFFMNFFCRILLSPLLPVVETALALSHGEAGGLFLFLSLGYVIALFGSGFVSSKLTHRQTILMSAVLVSASLFAISVCQTPWHLRLTIAILGLSAGVYIPSSIAMITSLVRSEHWGKAIAVHELAPNAAFILAPLLVGTISTFLSWRELIVFTGLTTLIVGSVFALWGQGGRFRGQAPNLSAFTSFLRDKKFWLVALLFSLGVSGTLGIFSMLPLYLVSFHELNPERANGLIGLSRIMSLVTALASGWLADRLGPSRTIMWVLSVTGIATALLGLLSGTALLVMLFVQPLLAVCFFSAGFVAISRISSEAQRTIAVSVVVPVGFLVGGGAVPAAIGQMGQHGLFDTAITLAGVLIGFGAVIAYFVDLPARS